VFNPADRSLLGVRHLYGLATLVRIPYPYTDGSKVHEFPWEHVPSDLDISPDGKLLSASMSDDKGDQFLRVWEIEKILNGDVKPLSEFRFGQSVPESFVFSPDGRYLYGSSYYTGVSNIFRYEVATGEVEAVSNAETGLFRPVPLADGRLVVLSYTGDGFVPAIIDPKPLKDVSAITFLGAELAEKHPVIGEVRGLGVFWALDLVSNRETRAMLAPYGGTSEAMTVLGAEAKKRGLLPFMNFNRLHVVPPCTVTEEETRTGLGILDEVFTEVDRYYEG